MSETVHWLLMYGMAIALPLLGGILAPKMTQELFRDLRFPRILHYVALAAMGMALFLKEHIPYPWLATAEVYLTTGIFVFSLSYAAIFAIVTNNLEDLEADRITNQSRPLVRGTVNPKHYLWAGMVCEAWALGLAALHSWEMLIGILAISVGYFIYSCRPLRLKRVPILAKLLIGANSWMVAVTGWTLVGGNWTEFPWIWSVFILIPLSFAANFVDLKDTEGDRATGIATLPVLLGERLARHVIALATLCAYAMGGILLNIPYLYPINAVVAVAHLYFLYRKPYDERWIFLIYVGTVFGLDFFMFWS
jgi:4-hydroxybenzoate polyprenyltransferase